MAHSSYRSQWSQDHPMTSAKNFVDKIWSFYVFKPIKGNELSEVLYKIQQEKLSEEASVLFASKNRVEA